MSPLSPIKHIFSGHETFPLRYTWIPKAVKALETEGDILTNIDKGIVDMGLGKNMIRALRFWLEAAGIVVLHKNEHRLTSLGEVLFGKAGLDPFLEDIRSLWVLHWAISTSVTKPLYAWQYLLGEFHEPEFTQTSAVEAFERGAAKEDARATPVTLNQHFDVFIHTYLPRRGNRGEIIEESLDCPLAELNLVKITHFRELSGARREPVYSFNRETKPEITPGLFAFALVDFWENYHPKNSTIDFRDICFGPCSPGQIFKLPESDIRNLLEACSRQFDFSESAAFQRVSRIGNFNKLKMLSSAFSESFIYAG